MICERGRHNIPLDELGIKKEQIVILSVAGSNMYGTATHKSDRDYLGVFLPTREDVLMNRVKKQIHLPKESGLDLQMWSIYYFLKLALQGETMAIDLLHAPYDCWVYYNPDLWDVFRYNKHMFYTKEMKAFVGYARKQAAKYGVKGNRIETLQQVLNFLHRVPVFSRLHDIWDDLPELDHVHFLEQDNGLRLYQVCGTKFQETVTVKYIIDHLTNTLQSYGDRAMKAANNEGIDWKAFSHAIRAANQVFDILTEGEYKYPLRNAKFIRMVKEGQIDYAMAEAVLTDYMDEIEKLMETSTLPETSVIAAYHFENGIQEYIERMVCHGQGN
jgi:hypothetical protein